MAIAPETPLRGGQDWWKLAFIVMAEKDGDIAYTDSDWSEGVTPWEFGLPIDLRESSALLRGTIFSDRGVYRLGEEVHLKAILRHNTPTGITLLAAGTAVSIATRDSQNRLIDQRRVTIGRWSSAEWTFRLPNDGSLGDYSIRAYLDQDRTKPTVRPGATAVLSQQADPDETVPYEKMVWGGFLVAAYRRPDFRVDVKLSGEPAIAGSTLTGVVTARYLFGAPMGGRPVKWTFSRSPITTAPDAVYEHFPSERWMFVGWLEEERHGSEPLRSEQATLAKTGELPLELKTKADAGLPFGLHARRGCRGRVAAAHREPCGGHRPPGRLVHRPPPPCVVLRRTEERAGDRDCRRDARGPADGRCGG